MTLWRFPLRYQELVLPAIVFGGFIFLSFLPLYVRAAGFQVDTNGTLTTNLVAYYKLSDVSESWVGGGTMDLTNHASTGFSSTSGPINGYADAGSGNTSKYLDYLGSMNTGSGAYSINCWINLNDAMSAFAQDVHYTFAVAGGGNGGYNYGMALLKSSNGHKYFRGYRNVDSTGSFVNDVDVVLSTGTWYMMTYTYDGYNQTIYIDNSAVGTGIDTSGADSGGATGVSLLSQGTVVVASASTINLPGKTAECGFWNKALGAQEITDLYSGGSGDALSSAPHIVGGTLQQYEADATTTITQGSTADGNKVVFGAQIDSVATTTVRLEVELATSTANFTGQVSASSSLLSSGTFATTSIANLANGSYYWRARAWDSQNNSSTWQQIGASSSVDFVVSVTTSTPSFPFQKDASDTLTTGLQSYYRLEDGGDAWGSAPLTNNTAVSFGDAGKIGNSADGGSGNTGNYLYRFGNVGVTNGAYSISAWVNLDDAMSTFAQDYEYVIAAVGDSSSGNWSEISFNNSSNGHKYLSGGRNITGSGGFVRYQDVVINAGSWHHIVYTYDGTIQSIWLDGVEMATSTDTSSGAGAASGVSLFNEASIASVWNRYLPAKIDEVGLWSKALSEREIRDLYNTTDGDAFSGLAQYNANGTVAMPRGGSTTGNSMDFRSTLYPSGTSTLQLQVEVQPTSTTFTGAPSFTSGPVSSGIIATTTILNLNPAEYHWQARVIDADNHTSTWQPFGTSGTSTDFIAKAEQSEFFSGSSSLTYSAASDTFAATDSSTFELWYRSVVPTSTVIDFIDTRQANSSSDYEGYRLNRDQDNGIEFFLGCDSGAIDFHVTSSSVRQNGNPSFDLSGIWHHIAVMKNSGNTTGAFNFYFDGVSQQLDWTPGAQGPISGNCFVPSTTASILLGKDVNSLSPNYLTGNLDEIRIWNTDRSTYIMSTWNQEVTSTDSTLRGLWRFNAIPIDLRTGNASSSQNGSLSLASSTPFGHFILGYSSVSGTQMIVGSSTKYTASANPAINQWNLEQSIAISTTTVTSTADLIFTDASDTSFASGAVYCKLLPGLICPFPTSTKDTIFFNMPRFETLSPDQKLTGVMHELGHALGLNHSYRGNIMDGGALSSETSTGPQDKSDYHFLWGN